MIMGAKEDWAPLIFKRYLQIKKKNTPMYFKSELCYTIRAQEI